MKKFIILFLLIIGSALCAHSQNQDFDIGLRRGRPLATGTINEKSTLTFDIEIDRKGIYFLTFEYNWSDIYWVGMGSGYDIYEELAGRVRKIKLRDVANKREILSINPIYIDYDLFSVSYVLEPGTYTFSLEIDAYAKVDFTMGFTFNGETTLDMPTKAELVINEHVSVSPGKNYVMDIMPMDTVKSLKIIDNQLALYGEYLNGNYNIKNIETPTSIQVQYFDGLGRPEQTVKVGITPSGNDLVSLQTYDAFGREDEAWLPGLSSGNGAYVAQATAKAGTIDANLNDQKPFSKIVYEPSPLNRPVARYGPGADWYDTGKGKAVRTEYLTNVSGNDTLNCIYYTATASPTDTLVTIDRISNFETGQIYVTRMEDEDGNTVFEFKDKLGRQILTRQVQRNGGGKNLHDTYYIYDDYDNLMAVLPPLAADAMKTGTSWTNLNSDIIRNYAYLYKYDHRNRCIAKRIPGTDWIYYIYDKADRLIFSQDGEQRLKGEWTFTLPDAFGRIVVSGVCKTAIPDTAATPFYKYLNDVAVKAESPEDANKNQTYAGTHKGYNANVTLTSAVYLSANYYDNYSFMGKNGIPAATDAHAGYEPVPGYGTQYTGGYKGLLTGTLTAQMNPTGGVESVYLYSVIYYDNRGRVIQTKSNNHLAGGLEKEYIAYNFTGQPIQRKHVHSATGKNTQTEVYTYTYDHAGRLLTTTHQLTDGTTAKQPVVVAENYYDELGRLASISRAGNPDLTTTYDYNIRSWLTGIHTGNLFNQKLYYNRPFAGCTPSWSGNISAINWENGISGPQSYKFAYDDLSRLTAAQHSGSGDHSTSYSYDANGNITSLVRGAVSRTFYHTGNQLKSSDDPGADQYDFNLNGAMTRDSSNGILEIRYNLLNLPQSVTFEGFRNDYTYASQGAKLKVDSTVPGAPVRDYVANKIYENGSLTQVLFDGGYYDPRVGQYYFYVRDHLGSNRVVVNQSGVAEQRSDFYPYGGTIPGNLNAEFQPWLYNGKEKDMTGLDWYDYGARFLLKGRWTTPDPRAEIDYPTSPYVYCRNNPIRFTDPDGRKLRPAANVSKEFMNHFKTTVAFMNERGTSGLLKQIEAHKNTVYIAESPDNRSYLNRNEMTIYWNPQRGILTDEGIVMSPATVLNHEADHANRMLNDPRGQSEDLKFDPTNRYHNKEEERVITTTEQTTALKHGEIEKGQVTRTHHMGTVYPTQGPTSTKLKEDTPGIIIEIPQKSWMYQHKSSY